MKAVFAPQNGEGATERIKGKESTHASSLQQLFFKQTFDCTTPCSDTAHGSHRIKTSSLPSWPVLLPTCPQPPRPVTLPPRAWVQPASPLSSAKHSMALRVPPPVLLLCLQPEVPSFTRCLSDPSRP